VDLLHYNFQFWKQGKDSLNDRLMYEIVETDVEKARERLCKLMKWEKVPSNLTVRISLTIMSFE
jgi:hypothetical protein